MNLKNMTDNELWKYVEELEKAHELGQINTPGFNKDLNEAYDEMERRGI